MGIDLAGLPIAITGASSGIGRATALACARAGMPVAVAARRRERLDELVEQIRREGGRAIAVACDVTDQGQCDELIERTQRELGSVYAVFANAGYGLEKPVVELSEAEIRAIFETNFYGSLNVIRPALAGMIGQGQGLGRGHVLFCSSCLSKVSLPYYAAYSATKAAQDHFGRALRHELAGTGVHVSTVHPIGTRTELAEAMVKRSGADERVLPSMPGRFKQTSEVVARAVVRCLRKPRGEVWTSTPMRLGLGLITAMPGFGDWVIGRVVAARTKAGK